MAKILVEISENFAHLAILMQTELASSQPTLREYRAHLYTDPWKNSSPIKCQSLSVWCPRLSINEPLHHHPGTSHSECSINPSSTCVYRVPVFWVRTDAVSLLTTKNLPESCNFWAIPATVNLCTRSQPRTVWSTPANLPGPPLLSSKKEGLYTVSLEFWKTLS